MSFPSFRGRPIDEEELATRWALMAWDESHRPSTPLDPQPHQTKSYKDVIFDYFKENTKPAMRSTLAASLGIESSALRRACRTLEAEGCLISERTKEGMRYIPIHKYFK